MRRTCLDLFLCSPWVVVSPLVPARGTTPLSTLMPTTMPLSLRYCVKGLPSSVFWYMVSWKRMTPPMQGLMRSSAVKRSWRYSLLFSSVFSALMLWKRLATLPWGRGKTRKIRLTVEICLSTEAKSFASVLCIVFQLCHMVINSWSITDSLINQPVNSWLLQTFIGYFSYQSTHLRQGFLCRERQSSEQYHWAPSSAQEWGRGMREASWLLIK